LVSQGIRPATTVAPQALWLMNNPRVREWAALWARQVAGARPEAPDRWLTEAYQRALQRPPTPTETQASLTFLSRQAGRYRQAGNAEPGLLSATDLLHALLGLNEVIHVD